MADAAERRDLSLDGAEQRGLSRRQLVKAGVWAAPVMVLATATPAAAGSLGFVYVSRITSTRPSGNGLLQVTVTITNDSSLPVAAAVAFSVGTPVAFAEGSITAASTPMINPGGDWIISLPDYNLRLTAPNGNNGPGATFTVAFSTPSTGSVTYGPAAVVTNVQGNSDINYTGTTPG